MNSSVLDTAYSDLAELSERSLDDVGGLSDTQLMQLNRLDAQLVQKAQTRLALSA